MHIFSAKMQIFGKKRENKRQVSFYGDLPFCFSPYQGDKILNFVRNDFLSVIYSTFTFLACLSWHFHHQDTAYHLFKFLSIIEPSPDWHLSWHFHHQDTVYHLFEFLSIIEPSPDCIFIFRCNIAAVIVRIGYSFFLLCPILTDNLTCFVIIILVYQCSVLTNFCYVTVVVKLRERRKPNIRLSLCLIFVNTQNRPLCFYHQDAYITCLSFCQS